MLSVASSPAVLSSRPSKKRERIFEIDFLRGFDVFLMIAVHFLSSFSIIARYGMFGIVVRGENVPSWVDEMAVFCENVFCAITQQSGAVFPGDYSMPTHLLCLEIIFAGLFVFLSGISCAFARNNAKRGFQLACLATAMTLVLYIGDCLFGTGVEIYMGILHALSIAILVYSLFNHFFPKWYQTFAAAIVLSIFALITVWFSRDIVRGYDPYTQSAYAYTQYNTIFTVDVNGTLFGGNLSINFGSFGDYLKLYIGLAHGGDDSFSPLLLTAILFLGATVGKTLYANKKSIIKTQFPKGWAKPFIFMGKHSLIIYLFHQVFFYIIIAIILLIFGGFVFAF